MMPTSQRFILLSQPTLKDRSIWSANFSRRCRSACNTVDMTAPPTFPSATRNGRQRMSASSRPMSVSDWTQLLLLGVLWGGSFFFARIAVAEIPPLALVLYRVSIAALALHLWLRLRGLSFAPVL